MKICVSAAGSELSAKVDARFGRAPYLLIIDSDSMVVEAVDNSGASTSANAGVEAAQLIISKGAKALLTGQVGGNVQAALDKAGVEIYESFSGADTVQGAVEKFKQGQVTASTASSQGPPGAGGGTDGCRREDGQGRGRGQGMGSGKGRGQGRRR